MKIPIRLRPFLHSAKAVPRRVFQGVLAAWLLGGVMGASYAGGCDAVYSLVERYGQLSVPCVQLDDGIVYRAQLDQVRGAKQFVFELKTTHLVNPPTGLYASFDPKNGTLLIPVIETNLGGKQKFYTVQMVKQGQSDAGNLIFGFADMPKGLNAQNPIPADLSFYAKGEKVPPGQAKKIAHQGAELEIGADAVSEETTLQIKSLAEAEIPPLPAGMINVTKGQRKGFRFLPHGMKFNKKIKLKLPYDKKLLPNGLSEQDIHTFYYDDQAKQWKKVERVAVDTGKQEIISQTDHFSDYVNAASCLAKIVFVADEHLPDFVEAGQPVTLTWKVKNTSSCDAVNYRMGFYSSTPSSSSDFGGYSHPLFTLDAGKTGSISAQFTAPQETVYFSKVSFDILDGSGTPLSVLSGGRLWANFTVEPSSAPPEPDYPETPDEPPVYPDYPDYPETPDEPPVYPDYPDYPDEPSDPPEEPGDEPDEPDVPPDEPDEPPPPPPPPPPPDPCEDAPSPVIHYADVFQTGHGFAYPEAQVTDEIGGLSVTLDFNGNTQGMTDEGNDIFRSDYVETGKNGTNSYRITAVNSCGKQTNFGAFDIRATDSGRFGLESIKCNPTCGSVGDPINTVNGNFIYQNTDNSLAGSGESDLHLTRAYNSGASLSPSASIMRYTSNGSEQTMHKGPALYFGLGWTSNLGAYALTVDRSPYYEGVQILYPDGKTAMFKKTGDSFEPDSIGNFDKLTADGDGYVLKRKVSLHTWRFNADGNLSEIADRNGNTISYSYENDLVKRIENSSGRWMNFTLNSEGQITQVDLPENISLHYEYNNGLLSAYINGRGNRTEFQYSADKQLVTVITPKSHPSVQVAYESEWRANEQVLGESERNSIVYADASVTIKDAYDYETQHLYDEQDRLIKQIYPDGTSEEYAYDDDNNRTYYKDQAGAEWHWTYDDRGNRLTADGPLGSHKAWEYNAQNHVVSMQERIDANTTRAFTFEYDDASNVVKVCMPLQDCATIQYDGRGLPTHFYDLANHLTLNEYDGEGDLVAVTNAQGATTRFEHDGLGRLVKLQKPLGNAYQYSYDPNSNLTAVAGPLGYQLGFEFDANDNLITKTDPNLGKIGYQYNLSDKVSKIENQLNFAVKNYSYGLMSELIGFQDAEGRAWTLTRDELSRITQIQGPLNSHSEFNYNAVGKIVDVIDAAGRFDHTEYDALYRAIRVIRNYKAGAVSNADTNVTTQYGYNLVGDVLQVIDPEGNSTHYQYDLQGRKISKQNAEEYEWQYSYDPMGNLLSVLNPRGYTTQIEYTPTYQVHKVIDPEQHAITLLYNLNGKLTDKIDRRGVITHHEYNELDRLVQRISNYRVGAADHETNVKTEFEYDLVGNLRYLKNPRGFTAELRYDAANRRTDVIDFEQGSTRLVYDKVDNVLSLTDANGHSTEYQYDALDQLVAVINAENETKQFEYDVVGNRTAMIEADATVTAYDYDALYRLNGVIQNFKADVPNANDVNVATQYGYDARGLLTSILNANANITLFEYDKVGQVIREIDPLNKVWEYAYDGVGNKVSRTDAKGNLTAYSYLPDDQLQQLSYFDETAVQYSYDPNNNRTLMQDGLGTTTWTYDPLNRRIAQDDPFSRVLTSVYDASGNRVGLGYADGNEVAYAYSPNNWLAQVTDPHGQVTAYERDKVGNITHITNPNAMVTDKTYDKVYRVLTLANRQVEGAKKTHSAFSYAYNLVGHVTQVVKEYGWQQPSEITETYTYDGVHRLATTTISPLKNNGDDVVMAYVYDAVGNRLAWDSNDDLTTHEPFDGFRKDYEYNANNQLLKLVMDSDKPNGDLLLSFLYDDNGNRINKLKEGEHGVDHFSTDYSYDPENRLLVAQNYQIEAGDKRTDRDVSWLDYDGGGRRLAKHYDPKLNQPKGGGVDKQTQYVFDGLDPVAEYSMLNGQRTDFYRGAANRLLTMHSYKGGTQGNMYWYHHNFKGDVSGLTKHNGNSHHNYRYDPYGGVVPENGNFTDPHNHYTLTGKEYDEKMGLVWFGARHYDPEVGVWVSQDSYRGSTSGPTSLHRYGYVGNNPTNYSDFYGWIFIIWIEPGYDTPVYDDEGEYVGDSFTSAITGETRMPSTPEENAESIHLFLDTCGLYPAWGAICDGANAILYTCEGDKVNASLSMSALVPGPTGWGTTTGKWGKNAYQVPNIAEEVNAAKKKRRAFNKKEREAGWEKSKDKDGTPRCKYCDTELVKKPGKPNSYEADHTNAFKNGGETSLDNLTPSCRTCNRSKKAKELYTEWTPPNAQGINIPSNGVTPVFIPVPIVEVNKHSSTTFMQRCGSATAPYQDMWCYENIHLSPINQ